MSIDSHPHSPDEGTARRASLPGVALTDRLSVLPVLKAQLVETASDVETAVVDVCANFQRMAQQASETVTAARAAVAGQGDASAQGMEAATGMARQTLDRLLARLLDTSHACADVLTQITTLEQDLSGVAGILDDVDRMARGTRLLGLNAAIEASRFGAQGKAFAVVAGEIEQMAKHSAHTSAAIRDVLKRLRAGVERVSAGVRQLASGSDQEVQASRGEVDLALATLSGAGDRMKTALIDASTGAERLSDSIGQAVVALQFQDVVSQRIAHVVQALDALRGDLEHLAPAPLGGTAPPQDARVQSLASTYTMDAERLAHQRACATPPPAAAAEALPDVELF